MRRIILAAALGMVLVPNVALALCVRLTLAQRLQNAELAFLGRVVSARTVTPTLPVLMGHTEVTFNVSRVWKGAVPASVRMYQVMSLDSLPFETAIGDEFVIFA